VRITGEHDISTVAALSETLSRAIAHDHGDLVIDMREVTYLDASTVGVLVRARSLLLRRSRLLTVRAPSACTRRILTICDLTHLIRSDPTDRQARPGAALARPVRAPVRPARVQQLVPNRPAPAGPRARVVPLLSSSRPT
jgi:anti-sigma B factor antagonist